MYHSEKLFNETIRLEKNEKSGKVDHPANGSKDLADAVAGVCFNCVTIGGKEPAPAPSLGITYSNDREVEEKSVVPEIVM